MHGAIATTRQEYKGYVILYGAYARSGQDNGWNGLYRITRNGDRIFGADNTSTPAFESQALAVEATRLVAEAYVDHRIAQGH